MKSTRTAGKTVLASSVFLGLAFGTAHSEICWRLTPFPDVIRATEITDNGNAPATGSNFGSTHNLLFGNWVLPGSFSTLYELPFVGAIEFDNTSTPTAQKLRLNIHASNHTTAFGNHTDCTLDTLLGSSGPGALKLSCTGNVPGIFNNSGTELTLISCENQPASAPATTSGTPMGVGGSKQ